MLQTLEDGTLLVEFPNGFRVVFVHKTKTPVATLVLVVGYGSQYETSKTNGTAHFIEHMLFKGSTAFPNPKDLNAAVARLGGDLTAFTGVETTRFILQAPDASLAKAFEILSEVVLRPLWRDEDVRRERSVVAEEIAVTNDDPNQRLENTLSKLLFSPHPYAFPVAGDPSVIKRLTAKQLAAVHQANYTPDNMVLCVVSDKPVAYLRNLVHKTFGGLSAKRRRVTLKQPTRQKRRMLTEAVADSQAYLALGGLAPAWGATDRAAFDVALSAMSGGLHARLPSLLRETLGEVYDVQAFAEPLLKAGYFGIYTDCEPAHAVKVLDLMLEQCRSFRTQPLTRDEVRIAAALLEGSTLIADEDQEQLGEWYATNILIHDRFETVAHAAKQWRRVSLAAAQAAIQKYFSASRLSCAAIAPTRVARNLKSLIT